MSIRIGIDATNLNMGGGKSHIINILNTKYISNNTNFVIHIWGRDDLLSQINDCENIVKHTNSLLNGSVINRLFWLFFKSKKEFTTNCDILFSPSGVNYCSMSPFVTMSRNMLLFDEEERRSLSYLLKFKLYLNRKLQEYIFKRADGVIFISNYAEQIITQKINIKDHLIIHHGISSRFKNIRESYALDKDLVKVLYVSHLYPYKHFDNVILAIEQLRCKGINIQLNIVGGGDSKTIKSIDKLAKIVNDRFNNTIVNHSLQCYQSIQRFYLESDIFVYASTCENMPNILLEAMSASMPISCSSKEPMPEFLKNTGLYFNSLDVDSIAESILLYINSAELRRKNGELAFLNSENFSWERTSQETFDYINKIYNNNK